MNNDKFHFVLILVCNKICGGAHYKMKMMVVVLDEKEYNNWSEQIKKKIKLLKTLIFQKISRN